MSNVVIYARYSSTKQREESIEGQIRLCKKYAENHDMKVIKEYIDRAETGRTFTDRAGAMQLIQDCKKGSFTAVLVYKFDRFSRDEADFHTYTKILKQNGVRLISISEDVGEGAQGTLIRGIHTAVNAYYSEELGEKVDRGMEENALKGKPNGSYRPFGYDIINEEYVINDDEAKIVKTIFEKYLSGNTVGSIISWCNERGYKNKQGNSFDHSFIDRLLKNVKYIGIYQWNGIVLENHIPVIIEKSDFLKVQKKMSENSNMGARAKAEEPYVLVGKAFCGLCEQPLVADSVKKPIKVKKKEKIEQRSTFSIHTLTNLNDIISGGSYIEREETEYRMYRYYVCRGQKRSKYKNDCPKKRMDKDMLENAVISYTAKQYLIEENLQEIATALYNVQKRAQANPHIKELENQIAQENKKIQNLLDVFEDLGNDKAFLERYYQAQVRKKDYESELELIKAKSHSMTPKEIYDKLLSVKNRMLEYIENGEIPLEVKQAFCDTFISKVYVFDEDDTGDNDNNKKIKVKIVFDAFESEGLLGFDDAEIELSSISEAFGSPNDKLSNKIALFKGRYFVIINFYL